MPPRRPSLVPASPQPRPPLRLPVRVARLDGVTCLWLSCSAPVAAVGLEGGLRAGVPGARARCDAAPRGDGPAVYPRPGRGCGVVSPPRRPWAVLPGAGEHALLHGPVSLILGTHPGAELLGRVVTRFPFRRDCQLFPEATIVPHRLTPHILRTPPSLSVRSILCGFGGARGAQGSPRRAALGAWEQGGGSPAGAWWSHRCEQRFLGHSGRRKQFSTELSCDKS